MIDDQIYFYATFTTPLTGYYGSAVCAFSLRDINRVFDQGRFKEQQTSTSAWLPVYPQLVPSPRPGACVPDTKEISDSALNFIKSHPLMDDAIAGSPPNSDPIFHRPNVKFSKLTVDQLTVNGRNFVIFYVATADGELYKIVQWIESGGALKANLVAVWRLPIPQPINALRLLTVRYGYLK